MNFRGHLIGGAVSGLALVLPLAGFYQAQMPGGVGSSMHFKLLGTTLIFSLFPDLDIQSIPQRWFYRSILILLLYLGYLEAYKLALFVSIVAILPLLSGHRGWTHRLWAPLFSPIFLAILYEYFMSQSRFFYKFSLQKAIHSVLLHKWFVFAACVGWFTHLCLDYLPKKLPKKIKI
ncbi:MAG: metal-dependent hydrolase [Gammaproteobacteria bacterium]